MQPFSLKRKFDAPASSSSTTSSKLPSCFHEEKEEEVYDDPDDVWTVVKSRPKVRLLEDEAAKAHRLKHDGILLAESEKYKAAIGLWDQAIYLTPNDATLYEMKSQALNELSAYFPAVQAAQMAVALSPGWPDAWLTLSRAQLNLGEPHMARSSILRAQSLNPTDTELEGEVAYVCRLCRHAERPGITVQSLQPAQLIDLSVWVWLGGRFDRDIVSYTSL